MVNLSVIIPTRHRNDDLANCLEALELSEGFDLGRIGCSGAPNFFAEVIVTDDSQELTAEKMIRQNFPWAKWFMGPRRGPAANRNHGASKASGRWLIFLDDDCIPSPKWLSTYRQATVENPTATIFEGQTVAIGQQQRADLECPINQTGGHLWSCNFAVRREFFISLGGFDELFPAPYLEDIDFQLRAVAAQALIKFVPEATVEHPWRRMRGMGFVRAQAKSINYFIQKHPESRVNFSRLNFLKRAGRALLVGLPRNLVRYRGGGSLRCLYLDLFLSYCVIARSPSEEPAVRALNFAK
jgi:GT2 family glycosyltransferase